MGSPVSPVVANLCMEVMEDSALSISTVPPKIWKRYVDDSFVIIKKDSVSAFQDILNSIDPKISFTIETENNGQIVFLDTLVTRKNGVITIDVIENPHTDRYLDYTSHHEKKHKISTAATLLNRTSNLPSTTDGKAKEIKHVRDALKANGYPPPVISNILKKKNSTETIPSPEELVGMFFKWAVPSNTRPDFACIPYISGLTEPLSRLLRNNGIRVVTKPHKTLQQEFPSPKFRPSIDLQTNVVYKISCNDCSLNYSR